MGISANTLREQIKGGVQKGSRLHVIDSFNYQKCVKVKLTNFFQTYHAGKIYEVYKDVYKPSKPLPVQGQ